MSEWQTPKTDWSASQEQGVSGEDFNRIEGNIEYIYLYKINLEIERGWIHDIENNRYRTVQIGNQLWTMDNVVSTKYNDGTDIPIYGAGDWLEWKTLTTAGMCFYAGRRGSVQKIYGALYNWYVIDPSNPKNIAPDGWRVATSADWEALENYLIANGYNWDGTVSGNKIGRSLASETGWASNETDGSVGKAIGLNNATGFSGQAAGYRDSTEDSMAQWQTMTFRSRWWTPESLSENGARWRGLDFNGPELIDSSYHKSTGASIRLVKDVAP